MTDCARPSPHHEQQAGLAGLAFDEGMFGVFGYVTEVRPPALTPNRYVLLLLPPAPHSRVAELCRAAWDGTSFQPFLPPNPLLLLQGLDVAYNLRSRDVITSARVISGADRLMRPS